MLAFVLLWHGSYSIAQCTLTAPYIETFDGTSWVSGTGFSNTGDAIDPCWTRNVGTGFFFGTRTGTTGSGTTGPSDDFTGGGKYVFTEGSNGTTGDLATITSPEIDLSALTVPYMTFYYHMYGATITSLVVEISNDGGLTWTTESTIVGEQQTTNSDPWMEQPINLSAYVNDIIQVRFSTTRGSSFTCDVAVDQLEIAEAPTCPKPTDFMSTSSTDVSIDLSWTNGGTETMWNIEYGPTGFVQGTGTFLPITTNPYTITGLTPQTTYDIYIQADCGGGDESDWVGPINVETQCGPVIAPHLESFDLGVLPNCWDNTSSNTGSANGLWKFSGTPGYGAANNGRPAGTFAWTDGSTPAVSDITLISPLVDMSALTVPMLSFDWFSNNEDNPGDNVPLIVDINDGSGWTNLLTLAGDNVNWQEEEITLAAYIGQTVQFRFITDQSVTTGNAFYNDILLDSVLIDEAPSCPKPTPINVSNVAATSADITWTAGYLETEWIVEYDTTGFPVGTGNTLVTNNLTETLNTLSPNTAYDVYVRAICAPGDTSEYRGPSSFLTPCVDFVAPFYENFEGSSEWVSGTGFNNSGDAISQCWSRIPMQSTSGAFWGTRTGPTSGFSTGPDTDYSGTGNYMYFESSYGSAGDTAELITPNIDMSNIDNPILTFYYHMYGTTTGTLQAEISNDGGATWDSLHAIVGQQQTAGDDPWEKVTVELYAYEDQTVVIRFLGVKDGTSGDMGIDEVSVYPCNPTQGQDGSGDICRTDGLFDLGSPIVQGQDNGTWSFPLDEDLIVDDTLLNVSLLPSGSYDAYYIVPGGCEDDTTVATINVFPLSSAGQNGNLEVCLNQPIDLFSGLNGNVDLGGTWYDPSNNPIAGSQPVASNLPGNYNYDYIVSNGVCPSDTSLLVVTVDGSCDYLSIGEEKLAEIAVYPNPATDVINISNPSNSEALRIQMLDMNGRVVISDENALVNVSDASINIEHLQKGIYTLRIYNEDGQRTFRIVKQ